MHVNPLILHVALLYIICLVFVEMTYYVVFEGRIAKWRNHQSNKKNKMKTLLVLPLLLTIAAVVLYSIIV